jgi:hypothetical protein
MLRSFLSSAVLVALAMPTAAKILTSANQAELHPIVAPTKRPNVTTTDPWTCVTESIRDLYFNPPRPSGALDDAHYSYGVQLLETCRTTGVFEYRTDCDFPDKTLWCGITTALPASLLPAYSAYASSAWSWWSAHSSSAVRVAQECPLLWYQIANNVVPGGAVWMNHTLINAECYAEAHQTVTGSRSLATGPTATPGQGATSVSAPASTSASVLPTQTSSVPSSGGKLPTSPTIIMLPMLAGLFAAAASAICQSL